MADIRKQIKKGLIEIAVLSLLLEKDMYGYIIIQDINSYSNGVFILKEGTLYPVLYRLEDNNLIRSYWINEDERSKPKKYYNITEKGKKMYLEMIQDYESINQGLNSILYRENVKGEQ